MLTIIVFESVVSIVSNNLSIVTLGTPSSLVTISLYVFLLRASAVTVIVIIFSPAAIFSAPVIVTVAFLSAGTALIFNSSVVLSTL